MAIKPNYKDFTCVICGRKCTYNHRGGRVRQKCNDPECVLEYGRRYSTQYNREHREEQRKLGEERRNTAYGLASHLFYGLRSRCYNKTNENYKNYGGKGIEVRISKGRFVKISIVATHCVRCGCEFIPKDTKRAKSTDRLDPHGHYEESNIQFLCRSCNSKKGSRIQI